MNAAPQYQSLLKYAGLISVLTALLLVAVKFVGYQSTGSIAILASLLDSLLDVFTSLANLIAIRFAMIPADKEHPFGHGKAEALAGLGQSLFITLSACLLIYHALQNIQNDREILQLATGVAIMTFSIIATALLILFQRYVYKKTASLAIKADSVHYLSDLLSNGLVIIGLGLTYIGFAWIDPIIAAMIGLYILYSAWHILKESIDILLDRELDETIQQDIKQIVLADPDVHAIHEMKTREAAHTQYIQLHIEMDGTLSLMEAHDISHRIMLKLTDKYPQADIIIHQDPENDAAEGAERLTPN